MSQLTIRLPENLSRSLDDAARLLQRRRSEIVRMALHSFLGQREEGRPAQRVEALLGSLESGVPDLAEEHRKYVLESLRDER